MNVRAMVSCPYILIDTLVLSGFDEIYQQLEPYIITRRHKRWAKERRSKRVAIHAKTRAILSEMLDAGQGYLPWHTVRLGLEEVPEFVAVVHNQEIAKFTEDHWNSMEAAILEKLEEIKAAEAKLNPWAYNNWHHATSVQNPDSSSDVSDEEEDENAEANALMEAAMFPVIEREPI